MLSVMLPAGLLTVAALAAAQQASLTFDHYSITVSDLDTSARFYKTVLSLPEIENKTQKKTIRWFSMGEGAELHLIEGNTDEIQMIQRIHLALKTTDLDGLITKLDEHDIYYASAYSKPKTFNVRPDGIRQIYFQDPDGYWIEINDVSAQTS